MVVTTIILLSLCNEAIVKLLLSYIGQVILGSIVSKLAKYDAIAIHTSYFISCGYCISVHTSAVMCLVVSYCAVLPAIFGNTVLDFFIYVVIIHRVSGLLHCLMDLIEAK